MTTNTTIKQTQNENTNGWNSAADAYEDQVMADMLLDEANDRSENASVAVAAEELTEQEVVEKVVAVSIPCLCGCGEVTKPKRNFRAGHDSRVKGMLSRAEKTLSNEGNGESPAAGLQDADLRLPVVLVDKAKADPDFVVVKYNADTINKLAQAFGVRGDDEPTC